MNTANSTNAINPPNSGQYMPVNIYEPAAGGRRPGHRLKRVAQPARRAMKR